MFPRELQLPWMVGLGLLLLLAPTSGAGCDGDCREKQNFYSCLTGSCFYMDRPDCGKCTANSSVCDATSPFLAGTCQIQGTNRVRIYSDCLLNCNCAPNLISVEAQALTVNSGDWIARDWWRCLSQIPGP